MNRSGVLVATFLTALVLASAVGAAAGGSGFSALQSGDVETDTVVLQATVDKSGDATWRIDYRIQLDDQNTTDAFESLQQDIQENRSDYRGQFADRMRSTVATAENATGREMAVENVTVSAETTFSGQYGVVSYSFDWSGFAATDGDRILLGDSLAGLFLDADTKLVFGWPEGYELQSVDPEPTLREDQSVTWEGPVDFGTNQPRLIVAPAGVLPAWAPTAGIAFLALLALLAGGLYYRQRESAEDSPEPDPTATTVTAESASESTASETVAAAGTEPASAAAPAGEEAAADTAEAESASGAESEAESEPEPDTNEQTGADSGTPTELLSPEERVVALMEERGGRMKQKVVTEELGWSAARTSQVVGDLRDAGKVESFRLGRENVLKFPDDDDESPEMP